MGKVISAEYFPGAKKRVCAILLALSGTAHGAGVIANGNERTVTTDIDATGLREDALSALNGGQIKGDGIRLTSKTGTLVRASNGGQVILDNAILGASFGNAMVANTGGNIALSNLSGIFRNPFLVSDTGSLLSVKNTQLSDIQSTFVIKAGAQLNLDNVQLASTPSASGAAQIQVSTGAKVHIGNQSVIQTTDNSVLKLQSQSQGVINQSVLAQNASTASLNYYPSVSLDGGSSLQVNDSILQVTGQGSGLSVMGASQAVITDSLIEVMANMATGLGVYSFGKQSQVDLLNSDISVVTNTQTPGDYVGALIQAGSMFTMTNGKLTVDAPAATGLFALSGRFLLKAVDLFAQQKNSIGILAWGSQGDIQDSTVRAEGKNANALQVSNSQLVTIRNSVVEAKDAVAVVLSHIQTLNGVEQHPLTISFAGSQVSSGADKAFLVQDGNSANGSARGMVTLNADSSTAITGDITVIGGAQTSQTQLHIRGGSMLTGAIDTGQDRGTTDMLLQASTWNMTSDSSLHNLSNQGVINLNRSDRETPAGTLHVKGDYAGDEGVINFATRLGGDDSLSNKMIVDGNTSGKTWVNVSNAGGTGAPTLNGIELITVGGQSDGEFVQNHRIVAGAYDYSLARGKANRAGNWYLVSALPDPQNPGIDPQSPGTEPPASGGGTKPVMPPVSHQPAPEAVRPEAGIYSLQLAAANTLFITRLHDRVGETDFIDPVTGQKHVTSMWLRNIGGHTRSRDGSGQLKTQANRYVLQLGGDIAQWTSANEDRLHLGVMGGYAQQKSHSINLHNGYSARGSISGYSAGLYATWLQDELQSGFYVDSWALFNKFTNSVSGKDLPSERYHSQGITASLESGYSWKMGEKNESESYYLQPNAQVVWMGVDSDDHREANGTEVRGKGEGAIQTRLGLRAHIKGHSQIDHGKSRLFEPFAEINWLHNTRTFSTDMNDASISQAGTRNIADLKLGVEGKLNSNIHIWGNVAQQLGGEGYSDTSVIFGVKTIF